MVQNLSTIRKELPRGSIGEIAKKTGLHEMTIRRIFKGCKSPKTYLVLRATANYLNEQKAKEREAMQAVNEALQN